MAADRRRLLAAASAVAAGLPLALGARAAPPARGGAHGGGPPVAMDDQLAFSLIASLLTLSEAQQDRLRTILGEASAEAQPIARRLDATREALFEAVKSGAADAALVSAADARGALDGRLLALQATTFQRLWKDLTAEQQASVEPVIFDYIGELLAGAATA